MGEKWSRRALVVIRKETQYGRVWMQCKLLHYITELLKIEPTSVPFQPATAGPAAACQRGAQGVFVRVQTESI